MCMREGHSKWIPHANLQSIQAADFNHGLGGPGYHVDRWMIVDRHRSDAHSHIYMDRNLGFIAAGFYERDGP